MLLVALTLVLSLPTRRPAPPEPRARLPVQTLGDRQFLLHRAPEPVGPQPLVVMLHGRGDSAAGVESTSGWTALATREGFTVVYPQAVGRPASFDAGWGEEGEGPDVVFLRGLVDEVARRGPVDRDRVYVCGFSSGGMMSARMAAAMPDRLAAVGVVAGSAGRRRRGRLERVPLPASPVPVAIVHGLGDRQVPYRGGGRGDFLSVPDTVGFFLRANHADGRPQVDRGTDVTRRLWTGASPRSEVLLIEVEGVGHQWLEGWPGQPLSVPGELWRFFQRHRS